MSDIVKNDHIICQILLKLGIERKVNSIDRSFYKTWLYDWGMSSDLIDYAVSQSVGRYMPMQYVNKILSEYHVNKINTLEDAKEYRPSVVIVNHKNGKEVNKTEYSKQQLESLFDDIDEIEI
jgi:DnaD/phage-associated family protein